jgi:hypothetical protein
MLKGNGREKCEKRRRIEGREGEKEKGSFEKEDVRK